MNIAEAFESNLSGIINKILWAWNISTQLHYCLPSYAWTWVKERMNADAVQAPA